ncbi:MAG TPA: hypothetical protein VIR34_11260 [Gemmatimonadaceae bacterium]
MNYERIAAASAAAVAAERVDIEALVFDTAAHFESPASAISPPARRHRRSIRDYLAANDF